MSDQELIAKAIDGDAAALGELLEKHAPTLRERFARAIPRRFQSVLSIEDVLQQTFTDAFLGIDRFRGDTSETWIAWLTAMANRNVIDAMRMLKAAKRGGDRYKIDPAQGGADSYMLLYDSLSASSTPSRVVSHDEAQAALEKALTRLPGAYREVVQRYDLNGEPAAEVAKAMNRSVGAMYMLRARAHDRLADEMGPAVGFFTDAP